MNYIVDLSAADAPGRPPPPPPLGEVRCSRMQSPHGRCRPYILLVWVEGLKSVPRTACSCIVHRLGGTPAPHKDKRHQRGQWQLFGLREGQ